MQGRGRVQHHVQQAPPPLPTTPPPPCPAPTLARAYFPFSTSIEAATVATAAAAVNLMVTAAELLVANKDAHARPNLCMRRTQWPFWFKFGLRCVVTSETSLDQDNLLPWSRFLSLYYALSFYKSKMILDRIMPCPSM